MLYLLDSLRVTGQHEVVITEAKYLDRARFEPLVCVLKDKEEWVAAELQAAGVDIVALGRDPRHPSLALLSELAALVRTEGIDVIHAHDYKAALYARLLSRGKLPVFWTIHDPIYDSSRRWKHHLFNRLLASYTEGVIGVSRVICDAICRLDGLPPHKVKFVANSINVDRFQVRAGDGEAVRRELGISTGTTLFISVGRLDGQKGISYTLRALSRLHEDCKALIVGQGPEEEPLKRQAVELGIQERVVFAGAQRSVGRFLAAADAFVMPSLFEGMSVALLEAMYVGLPVITTPVGETGAVVTHGVHGLLVPPNDAGALAEAMEFIAADPERARRMGRAGRERVEERFLPRHHVGELEALYEEALARRRSA